MAPIEAQDSDLRKMIGSFRILIIGRRNAGKTTILQKVCDTIDNPEIYDTNGKKIDDDVVKDTIKRGNHNIRQAMVFKSKPEFVFHDSCGFEGGSTKEFEEMKQFISEGVNARKLEERIHAIWYCIPMNEWNRTFQKSEEKFFLECDTGNVPVVVVFTKFGKLLSPAKKKIKEQLEGLSEEECSRRITESIEELFTNTGVLDRLNDPKNLTRPKSYVRLQNMKEPNANCDNLLESTTFALDDIQLRLFLVSTQQSNLELCIKCAVATLVDHANRLLGPLRISSEEYQYEIAKWFPHLSLVYTVYVRIPGGIGVGSAYTVPGTRSRSHNVPGFNDKLFNSARAQKDDIIAVLRPLVDPHHRKSAQQAANRLIQTGIDTIIVLEYSACLLNSSGDLKRVKSAVKYYLQSPTAVAVEEGAKEISCQGYKKEELKKKIFEFIIENRMSKELPEKK